MKLTMLETFVGLYGSIKIVTMVILAGLRHNKFLTPVKYMAQIRNPSRMIKNMTKANSNT